MGLEKLRSIFSPDANDTSFQDNQTNFDSLALDISAGDWIEVHKSMLELSKGGSTLHHMMYKIHEHVKTIGLDSQSLYAFLVVWGNFVMKMHQWPLSDESFIDYFVAALCDQDNNTGGQ